MKVVRRDRDFQLAEIAQKLRRTSRCPDRVRAAPTAPSSSDTNSERPSRSASRTARIAAAQRAGCRGHVAFAELQPHPLEPDLLQERRSSSVTLFASRRWHSFVLAGSDSSMAFGGSARTAARPRAPMPEPRKSRRCIDLTLLHSAASVKGRPATFDIQSAICSRRCRKYSFQPCGSASTRSTRRKAAESWSFSAYRRVISETGIRFGLELQPSFRRRRRLPLPGRPTSKSPSGGWRRIASPCRRTGTLYPACSRAGAAA